MQNVNLKRDMERVLDHASTHADACLLASERGKNFGSSWHLCQKYQSEEPIPGYEVMRGGDFNARNRRLLAASVSALDAGAKEPKLLKWVVLEKFFPLSTEHHETKP